jgi:hypothetical protein
MPWFGNQLSNFRPWRNDVAEPITAVEPPALPNQDPNIADDESNAD